MADLFDVKIHPMLAALQPEPFDSEDHIFELKWDGTRALGFVSPDGSVKFQNRRLYDITYRYPEIHPDVGGRKAILDGEIVVMREGRPSFMGLQDREHASSPFTIRLRSKESPATYVVFDVLYLDGKELLSLPLMERKDVLRTLVRTSDRVTLSDYIEGQGRAYYAAIIERGLEGIIAKRKGSRYALGRRTRDWLKVKKRETIDAVVCGLTEGEGVREDTFGSLILGVYDGPTMRYIGRVGTGFSDDLRRDLLRRCEALRGERLFASEPDMTEPVKLWMRPGLVVEARFLEMTPDGMLRAPSFGRIRDDKRPEECVFPRADEASDDGSQSS
ncbi:MAG: DNA ligase [Methanobacteriota archaeon]|nr:MAG: DNA ligase [Euryarchaeota archaeon]